ncbi:MAG: putative lipid II flippase FtsW [Clostridiales bacterium]|nr:putative lipid II flippase FtsW [Clostridiales bacterium]
MEKSNEGARKQRFIVFATGGMDLWFCILVIILMGIGLVMMFSASYASALDKYGDPLYYFKKQAVFAAMGLAAMFVVSRIHYRTLRRFSKIILVISFILLVVVLFYYVKIPGKEGFKRWMKIPGTSIQFQPSEVAKLGLIWFLAWSLEYKQYQIRQKDWRLLMVYCAMIAVMSGLVYAENHLSGAILILAIGITMTYLGGFKKRWYVIGGLLLLAIAVMAVVEREHLPGRIQERINGWLDPEYDPINTRWQINQSLRAIGSGGLFGTGLGQSKQKHLYLPEPQNDFIFAIVCEELGYIGAIVIMLLFVLLVWRGFVIALHADNKFAGLLVVGIMFQIGFQTALNICVVTGVMPNTGISLPFFSYGGTSLLMIMAEMGMVLSVSRSSKIKKNAIL